MGRDKANVLLGEQTLLQHVITAMQKSFSHIILSVREPRPDLKLLQVCDAPDVSGPLAGVLAGLEQSQTPWIFLVACDMPFMQATVIESLSLRRDQHQAVVPIINGHAQPMAAFYARSILPVLRAHLAGGGKNSLRALFEHLDICYVDETELAKIDPTLNSFFDLDTPRDLANAMNRQIPHESR